MNPSDLCVIVPTRGRPQNTARLLLAWKATGADGLPSFVVDSDDPCFMEYSAQPSYMVPREPTGGGMVDALNEEATRLAWPARAVGFMGDDHLPRTSGWDVAVAEALGDLGSGIVYCNDLFQGENLPTAVFMTADIVRALGYMAPPVLRHLYVDNVWKAWGEGMGRLAYLEDVIIEHVHPAAGKAEWDDGYLAVNNADLYATEAAAYERYTNEGGLEADLAKLRALL